MKSSTQEIRTDHESGGIVRRGGISLMGAVVGGTLVVVNEILAARFLGLHDYACYALAFVTARFAEIASLVGLQIGVVHFIPLFRQRGQMNRVAGTILAALAFPLAASLGFIVLIWNVAPSLSANVLNLPDATPYLRGFAFAIPMLCLSDLLGHATRGFGHAFYHVLVRNLVPPISYFLFLMVLITIRADRLWIAAAYSGSYFLAVLVGIVSIARVAGPSLWRDYPLTAWRELYSFSFPIVINSLLYVVVGAADLVMLSALRTSDEVSIYRGAIQMLAVFQVIITAFGAGAAHIFALLSHENRKADLDDAYGTTTRWITVTCVAASVTILLNRVGLLALLGTDFTAGSTAMAILVVGQLIRSNSGSAPLLLVLSRHQRAETFNVTIGLILNVILNLILIPRYGMVGAASATTTAYLVMAMLQVGQVHHYLGLRTIRAAGLRAMAVGVGIMALGWIADQSFGWSDSGSPWVLAARIPIVALLLILGLWRFGLEPEDRDLLKGISRKHDTSDQRSLPLNGTTS